MASNIQDQIQSDLRQIAKIGNDYSEEEYEEVEEKVYIPLQKKQWDTVLEKLNEIEEEYDFNLERQKQAVKQAKNPDKLEQVNERRADGDASNYEKLLIENEVAESSGEQFIGKTDEQISTENLFTIHENIYNKTGKTSFIISPQNEWDGRVAVELSGTKTKYELLEVYEDGDGKKYFKHFGQTNPNKGYNQVAQLAEGFYEYKFIADDQEYRLLSREKLDTVRCKVKGTKISLNDAATVGENRRLPVNQDLIFVHSVDPAVEVMTDEELDEYREGLTHDGLAESLLGGWRQPEWFEKFLLADLLVNDENGHPSHVLWTGPPGTGKSRAVESGLKATNEKQKEPFTGSGSTVKGLTPSFKENPPDEGYLLRTQRLAGVDEKMDLLSNTVQQNNDRVSDVFRPLLNLLTHDTRKFESGNGSIKGEMSSTMWAAGNLNAYGISSIQELAEDIDDAYLSRLILYNQTDSHIEFIDDRKAEIKNRMQKEGLTEDDLYPEPDDQFISLLDTMREERFAVSDFEKIAAIRKELREIVPGYMQEKYRARYEHHMTNIVNGLAKYHYLVDNRDTLEVQDEDYEEMRSMFETIISSWGEVELSKLSETAMLRALTPPQRRVFNAIDDQPGLTAAQLAEELDVDRLGWVLKKLKEVELVVDVERDDGEKVLHPFWTEEAEEELGKDTIL